jgi:transposase
VTLQLLWEEHRAVRPDGCGYSRFCELYRAWEVRLSPTMRQSHVAGERLFVDYAGTTLEVIDASTGLATRTLPRQTPSLRATAARQPFA